MNPSCYSMQSNQQGLVVLYLDEVSTLECLAVFSASEIVELSEFGATAKGEWQSTDSVPKTAPVSWWASRLADGSISVVDFSGRIGQIGLLTHDDGEASFVVGTKGTALQLLERLVGKIAAEAVSPLLLNNPGSYVASSNGRHVIYPSFEAYVDGA
jgi:hypothetical protein